jgi:Malectin domain
MNPDIHLSASLQQEWKEFQAVLQSEIFQRAPNPLHFLKYVGDKYFSGNTDQIKEYSIAVHALNRPEQFDPKLNNIVRVTASALRKKLDEYYAMEGAHHTIRLRIPTGSYVPQFEHIAHLPTEPPAVPVSLLADGEQLQPRRRAFRRILLGLAILAPLAVLLMVAAVPLKYMPRAATKSFSPGVPADAHRSWSDATPPLAPAQDATLRIYFGANRHPYTDIAGQTWVADQFCTGGRTFSLPPREVQGTDNPALFENGREGKFSCRIPVRPGAYQLQLLFADSKDKEGGRWVEFSINNGPTTALDIVDEAGGNDIVVGKVYPGLHPMGDGFIHLDFTSPGAFINAAELTPTSSDGAQTLRMLAGPEVFRDDQGNLWLPDRFFLGGRRADAHDRQAAIANPRLFEWERYGHFRYLIPVVAGTPYRLRLYVSERWFGASNGGPGGVGSRIFDVYCNGTTLLKNFDILKDHPDGTAILTFDNVQPTAHGMLDLSFVPAMNYALINAISLEPENLASSTRRPSNTP